MSVRNLLDANGKIPTSMIDRTLIDNISNVSNKVLNLESNLGTITTENITQKQEDLIQIKSTLEDIQEKIYALYLSNFNPNLE